MFALTNNGINPSNPTIKGFFRFGRLRTDVIEFSDDTNMVDIDNQIQNWFNHVLPSNFHVEFYSYEAKQVFTLDANLLMSEYNPFQSSLADSSQMITYMEDYIQFMIVDDSPRDDSINSQSNTWLVTLSPSELDSALCDTSIFDECNEALLPPPLVPDSSIEDMFTNNDATNGQNEEDIADDITDINSVTVENLLEQQTNSQNSVTSSADYQLATETLDEIPTQPDRITFSHDVHPDQKHHHLTDKFNIEDGSSAKGGISFLQGAKTKEEIDKKRPVLPHLLIPPLYRLMEKLILLLYAVYEKELQDGTRIWYKNQHKGFVSKDQLKPDAEFLNPFELVLKNSQWTKTGDYRLKIYLLTKRKIKSKNEEEIHRLSKTAINQIHKAEHVEYSKRKPVKPTRIICVPVINTVPNWLAFGISNFIQPPVKKPKPVALCDCTTVPSMMPAAVPGSNAVDALNSLQPYQINISSVSLNAITAVAIQSPSPKRRKI